MGLKRNPFCRSADTVSSWILFASFCVRSRDEAAPCWRLTNGELAKGLADHCGGHLWCRRSEKKKNEKNNKNQQQTNVFRCVCWIANWNSLLFLRSFVRLFVALWGSFPWSRLPISVHFVIAASPFSRVLLGFFCFVSFTKVLWFHQFLLCAQLRIGSVIIFLLRPSFVFISFSCLAIFL